jgi:hypothetical protein
MKNEGRYYRNANLVINIGDVHDKIDIVAKVIRHNSAQDVLGDVVSEGKRICGLASQRVTKNLPCMTHVGGIVYSRTAIVPFDTFAVAWDELILGVEIEC